MGPSEPKPLDLQFPRFRDLPANVRREVYAQLLPRSSSRHLWLKQSAYFTPSQEGEACYLLGSPGNYVFRMRRGLQYTGLTELGILPRPAIVENEDNHKTLLALRLVSRDIGAEAEGVFFGREGAELWLELDSVFAPFLKECVAGLKGQKNANHGLLKWLSRFRRMAVFLQEDLVPELGLLRAIFEDELKSPEEGMTLQPLSRLESPQGRHRDLTFVIVSFHELVADTYNRREMPAWDLVDGNGDLPPALIQKDHENQKLKSGPQFEQDEDPIPIFTGVTKIGAPKLWVRERPPIIGVGDTANRNDRMFYKIAWSGRFDIPATDSEVPTAGGEKRRHRFPVQGCYISWTAPGVMKDLLGWEPSVIKDDPDWIYEQRGVFMMKTGRTPALADPPEDNSDPPE